MLKKIQMRKLKNKLLQFLQPVLAMASKGFDVNAYASPFMLTKSLQKDVYPIVDPTQNFDLRADNKVVLIIGGAGSFGFATAKAWIAAGAKGVVLVGRTQETLERAVHDLNSNSDVLAIKADITIATEVDGAFKKAVAQFGQVDVVINTTSVANAGPVGLIDPSAWLDTLESKGIFNVSQGFININGGKGTLINLISALALRGVPGMSIYIADKLAQIKLLELIDIEQPSLRVFSVHPGFYEAENGRGVVVDALKPFAIDTAALTAKLTLWLDTPKADFLKGRYIRSKWDLNELKQPKADTLEKKLMKLGFLNG